MKLRDLVIFAPIEDHMDNSLREVMQPLQQAIAEINREMEDIKKSIDDEDRQQLELDWFYEDRRPMIEDFLGLSFVACQVYIRRVTSQLVTLHERERKRVRVRLETTSGTPIEIARFGDGGTPGVPFSKIEVLWEFANYYKHKDDWGDHLPETEHERTVAVVRAVSGERISMFKASEYLGNPADYANVNAFADAFLHWRKALVTAYQQELKAKGL